MDEFADRLPLVIIYEEFAATAGHAAHRLGVPAACVDPSGLPGSSMENAPAHVPLQFKADHPGSFSTRLFTLIARPLMHIFVNRYLRPQVFQFCAEIDVPREYCFLRSRLILCIFLTLPSL